MTFIIIIALVVVAGVALRLAVPTLVRDSVAGGVVDIDGQSSLKDCPQTPNCQGSESTRSSQMVDRFPLTIPAEQAIDKLAGVVSTQAGVAIVSRDSRYLHVTFTTSVMAYVDDVEFLVSDDNVSVQVRSASRLGKSDLGANGKRIESLRDLIIGNDTQAD